MKFLFYLLFVVMFFACGNASKSSEVSTRDKDKTNEILPSKSSIGMEESIEKAFYAIPEKLISLKDCLGDDSQGRRKNLIKSTTKNTIRFLEPCNGGSSEFTFVSSAKIYLLSVCSGGPGCNQKVFLFDEKMTYLEDAIDPNAIEGFLKKNPLVKKRLQSLNMPTDPEESIVYSVNKETNMIELVPDPEFTNERVPLGRAKMVDGKLIVTQ